MLERNQFKKKKKKMFRVTARWLFFCVYSPHLSRPHPRFRLHRHPSACGYYGWLRSWEWHSHPCIADRRCGRSLAEKQSRVEMMSTRCKLWTSEGLRYGAQPRHRVKCNHFYLSYFWKATMSRPGSHDLTHSLQYSTSVRSFTWCGDVNRPQRL